MRRARLAVLLSGNGSNFQAILDAIASQELAATVAVVVANRADAYGLERAAQAGIPSHVHLLAPYHAAGRPRTDYDADLAALLTPYAPDWVVLAGWMHLLSNTFLQQFPNRVINLHPALPGMFPGTHAIERAFAAYQHGEISHTGAMVHFVPDEQVDAGPVIATATVPIHPTDTLVDLEARLHMAEHKLLVDALMRLIA